MTDHYLMERLRAQVAPWRGGHHMPGSIGDIMLAIERIAKLESGLREISNGYDCCSCRRWAKDIANRTLEGK